MLKPFFAKISKSRQKQAQNGSFGLKGCLIKFKIFVCNPKKAHLCMEPRLLTYFLSKSVRAAWR